jgi:cyanophycinase
VSIHLVGGGPFAASDAAAPFLAEATARSAAVGRTVPRIGLLSVAGSSAAGVSPSTADIAEVLGGARQAEVLVTEIAPGEVFSTTVLSDVDALVVGGGVTPHYLDAVAPLVDQIRLLVSDGLPYLGYSAGAMIASDRALIGGWRIGVEICPEAASEGLDEVELREGLGLVDLTIDVHAVQAGTLARLVASAEAEFVTAGIAIDEDTTLVVGEGALEVRGTGSVWRVVAGEESVAVATMGA